MSAIPTDVLSALESLGDADKKTVLEYIESILPSSSSKDVPMTDEVEEEDTFEAPMYDTASNQEDYDKAADCKQQAADYKSQGDLQKALDYYDQAVVAAPPSALLLANRALVLEQLGHYRAAERDCNAALALNPDSGKALKVRGNLRYRHLNDWHGALSDLSQAQTMDYDPQVAENLKELTKLRLEEEKKEAAERLHKEEAMRKKAQDIKKAQEDAKREATEKASRGMPGEMPGGMPGGMPGMPGMPPGGMGGMMEELMKDPELQEAMKNPKVVSALQELMNGPGGPIGLMANPGKLQQLMADPDVGPVLQKLMGKFMGGMGGMPGAGMGGMAGAGMGGGGAPSGDDIPDLDDLPDLE